MSKPGPKPTPTATLKLRGSWLVNNRKGEPHPEKGRPACPAWISAGAKAVWKQITPQLEAMGVLTKIDGNALIQYCVTFADWRRMTEFIDEHGETYPIKDEKGKVKYIQQLPQVAIRHKLRSALAQLESDFGLNPSSRSRIQVLPAKGKEDDRKDRFFKTG